MFPENQILTGLKEIDNPAVLHSLINKAVDYYASFKGGEDEFINVLTKGIARGYAKEAGTLLKELTENYSFPQLLPLEAEAFEKSNQFYKVAVTYLKLLELVPNEINYLLGAAENLQKSGRFSKAIKFYKDALKSDKNNLVVLFNLGMCYRQIKDWENAEKYFELYSKLNPEDAGGFYNRGVIKEKKFEYENAEDFYRQALSKNENFPDAHWNLSLILLRKRRYSEGWAEFEWRKQMPFYKKNNLKIREWKGENLSGKNIMIYSEQGFGDVIQFLRFVENVRLLHPAEITAVVPSELNRLFNYSGFFDYVASDLNDVETEKYDFKVSFLSLPYLLNPAKEDITLKKSLFDFDRINNNGKTGILNIGIVWKGNREHENSKLRDINLHELLKAIGRNSKVIIHSLQVGEITDDEKKLLEKFGVINHAYDIKDFYDTAEIINSLDIVISVDTAVLHLSGSMMKETWALIPFNNDWRWGEGEKSSEWYPSVKIIRQEKLGDWRAPLSQVKEMLSRLINEKQQSNDRDELEIKGSAYFNNGQLDEAVKVFRQITEIYGDARAYSNLGIVLKQSGKSDEAIDAYYTAITADKNYFAVYTNLIAALIELGRYREAEEVISKALNVFGELPELVYYSAVIYHKKGELDKAYSLYLKIYPYHEKGYLFDFTTLLIDYGKTEFAREILEANRENLSGDKRYYFLLGNLYKSEEKFEFAGESYLKALEIQPDFIDAKMNLASIKFLQRKINEAEFIYSELLKDNYSNSDLYYNLGIIKQERKEFAKSREYFNSALKLEKKPEYYFALAEVLLTEKDFTNGLPLYEKRLDFMNLFLKPKLPQQWKSMQDKKMLVFEEQGIGDTFQFARFIPPLREIAGEVTLAVRPRMTGFWESAGIADRVAPLDKVASDDFDVAVPIVSLFYLWYQAFGSIPKPGKYITLSNNLNAAGNNRRRIISLAWRGNPNPVYHRKRHMELKTLEPVIQNTDADFFVLQNELTDEEKLIVNRNPNLFFLPDIVNDWNKLSDLIAESDLVLSVDTVYAHLAGALGKETFVMLPYSADWRWGINDDFSYWYGRTQLFRQTQIDDWSGVMKQLLLNLNSE